MATINGFGGVSGYSSVNSSADIQQLAEQAKAKGEEIFQEIESRGGYANALPYIQEHAQSFRDNLEKLKDLPPGPDRQAFYLQNIAPFRQALQKLQDHQNLLQETGVQQTTQQLLVEARDKAGAIDANGQG